MTDTPVLTNLISRDVLHRVCNGVGSIEEGKRLQAYVEDLELRARAHERPSGTVTDGSLWYCPACGTSGPVEPKAPQVTMVGGLEMFVGAMGKGTLDTSVMLSRCPFCGHEAAFTDRGKVGHDHYTVAAQCSNTSCGVRTPEHYKTREAAAEAWNRRVENRE